MHYVGIGSLAAPIYIYIENIPPLPFYEALDDMHGMQHGEIADIGKLTGNHWRKVFNVFAKFEFEREPLQFETWQNLRDEQLLTSQSTQCLLFSEPEIDALPSDKIHIIMGKTYATKLGLAQQCHWLNEFFAFDEKRRVIICPYFDYRQLSNIKITQLTKLIEHLNTGLVASKHYQTNS